MFQAERNIIYTPTERYYVYIYKGYTARNTDNQQRHLNDDHDTALSPDKSHSTVDINTIADSSVAC